MIPPGPGFSFTVGAGPCLVVAVPSALCIARCCGQWEARVRWQSCCMGLPSPVVVAERAWGQVLSASCAGLVSRSVGSTGVGAVVYVPCCTGLPSSRCRPGEDKALGPERVVGSTVPLRLRGPVSWSVEKRVVGARVPRRGPPVVSSSSWKDKGSGPRGQHCALALAWTRCRGQWGSGWVVQSRTSQGSRHLIVVERVRVGPERIVRRPGVAVDGKCACDGSRAARATHHLVVVVVAERVWSQVLSTSCASLCPSQWDLETSERN
jgi:hypothetical protein